MEKLKKEHTGQNTNVCLKHYDVCPLCNGTGWEIYEKDGYEYSRECKCMQKQKIDERVKQADLPKIFESATIGDFELPIYRQEINKKLLTNAIKGIRYWIDNFETMKYKGIGLYIYSATKGSGKTRMIAGIANELISKKQVKVKFTTSLQILNEIRACWDNDNQNESRILKCLSEVDVLIIDDFGTEQAKEWVNDRFYQIINERYTNRKITLFTSNSRLDELKYDERIISRIKERVYQIPFAEEDIRKIIADKNKKELIKGIKGG